MSVLFQADVDDKLASDIKELCDRWGTTRVKILNAALRQFYDRNVNLQSPFEADPPRDSE